MIDVDLTKRHWLLVLTRLYDCEINSTTCCVLLCSEFRVLARDERS